MSSDKVHEALLPMFAGRARILVQPDDGVGPVVELMGAARQSIAVKQFTFTHPALLEAALATRRGGLAVRVMLNPHRSSGDRANDAVFEQLKAGGVEVEWSNPRFAVTHEKSMVIDDRMALIATFNFCEKYFSQTRDYGLVIEDRAVVAEILACFQADWSREPFHPQAESALLWSNNNSRRLMSTFIDSAQERLDIQHPKFVDATILDRLVQARSRGVHIRVLCGGRHGISEWDVLDTFASLRTLQRLDVKVHKQRKLRLHAKLLLADHKRALVGSMNIDRSAFDLRRELGLILSHPETVHGLERAFERDWADSHHYEPPDPLLAAAHVEDDFPHDPELAHE
jgi:phosphatidylserine/phosphatidylglycerophosphate/cardiolipin synthase-like enzyme